MPTSPVWSKPPQPGWTSPRSTVASFFVSRVDTAIDDALATIGTPEAAALAGEAGIANARLAWAAYEEVLAGARWKALAAKGANKQRPLWASTGVKNPAYPDDRYVVDLAAPGCVNTMPEKTMDAVRGHGNVTGDTVSGRGPEAQQVFDRLTAVGVDLDEVFETLGVRRGHQVHQRLAGPAQPPRRRPGTGADRSVGRSWLRAARRRRRTPTNWGTTRCGRARTSGCRGSPDPARW